MMQQGEPGDYMLATGVTHTVREFAELAFRTTSVEIGWEGTGINEVGRDRKTGEVRVEMDPRYFRPAEVDMLCGDASLAREERFQAW